MNLGVLKETAPEKRVAVLPELVPALKKLNIDTLVETDAGASSFATNEAYQEVGAKVVSKDQVLKEADIILSIHAPDKATIDAIATDKVLISVFNPLADKEIVNYLLQKSLTTFSMDMVPRTTRAQAMDILSSMATVAGYKAVLEAANTLPRFFPMFMTAAGTIKPSKILILGAGVAGLQAIATARKLGAVVEVFDVRAAVKEEVMSLGGKFIEVEGALDDKAAGGYAVEQTDEFKQRQKQLIHDHAVKSDVIICTAQIPGRRAPLLIEKATVEKMRKGSVVIDLAASTGGNCEVTENNKQIEHAGITIIGKSNFPAEMPSDASSMYGKNVLNFLKLLVDKDGKYVLNFEDDIVKGTCLTHNKEVINERVKQIM